jgi:hypothetical protein
MSKEKSRSFLNLRRLHTWQSVPFLFLELRHEVVIVVSHHRPHGPSKTLRKEVAQLLEPTETPHSQLVPYLFFELRLQVVVVGLPLLAVNEVAGADLGSILLPVSARVPK